MTTIGRGTPARSLSKHWVDTYIRRRLAQDAHTARIPVCRDDLQRVGAAVTGLADEYLMPEAWR